LPAFTAGPGLFLLQRLDAAEDLHDLAGDL
jgi:hypothetical protein